MEGWEKSRPDKFGKIIYDIVYMAWNGNRRTIQLKARKGRTKALKATVHGNLDRVAARSFVYLVSDYDDDHRHGWNKKQVLCLFEPFDSPKTKYEN